MAGVFVGMRIFIFFPPKPGGLKTQILFPSTIYFICMQSYPFTPGWYKTNTHNEAVGDAVPCLRGPQWGIV